MDDGISSQEEGGDPSNNNVAAGGAAENDVNPQRLHERRESGDDDEEGRTRLMELAQQQQMALQLLDDVDDLLRQRRRQSTNDNEGISHHRDHERRGASVTQIYFVLSALFAFLAVVTTTLPPPFHHSSSNVRLVTPSTADVSSQSPLAAKQQYYYGGNDDVDKKMTAAVNFHDDSRSRTWHSNDGDSSSTRTNTINNDDHDQHATRKNKIVPSSSSSSSSWEELFIEAFESIKHHYKMRFMTLKHFWMFGELTPYYLSTNPSAAAAAATATATATAMVSDGHNQRDDDPSSLLVLSILPSWTTSWTRKIPWNNNYSDNVTAPSRKNSRVGDTTTTTTTKNRNHNFSLYSVAMDVIDPFLTRNLVPLEKKASSTSTIENFLVSSSLLLQSSMEDEQKLSVISAAEKILSSTPRLIAIANLILALVYLFHAAIADLFLGTTNNDDDVRTQQQQQRRRRRRQRGNAIVTGDERTRRNRRLGRERLGGYLFFKLLLISSVLDPSTEDLLILFAWYMLLSFLRSLAHLAGSTSGQHISQSGLSPRPGALRLLIAVLICDIVAAMGCVALFRGAGWHMLLLLTCDCALVGADAMGHIVKHVGLTMEVRHRSQVSSLEGQLASLRRRGGERVVAQYRDELLREESEDNNNDDNIDFDNTSMLSIRRRSELEHLHSEVARLEQEIEDREAVHTRRLRTADIAVFGFELSALLLTMAHFMHIWAWHGASFGLVDFVLALHLHSTVSIIGKKIAERRTIHRIAAQLNSYFKEADDLEIRKASAAGDVCCICLNSLTVGNVKKVGCGHLFHTQCLREVVERERSIQAVRCPLCRANLITGRQCVDRRGNNNTNETVRDVQPTIQMQNNLQNVDTSLLRFSTEGWLPSWLPVPAFSFEVVRRETPVIVDQNSNPGGWQRFFRRGGQMEANDNGQVQRQEQQQQQQGDTSFWRRLFVLLGVIPMSAEEEAIALDQLVDMFPQYERSDLLRELRARRSAEAVVESILLGLFSGVPRGS